MIKEIIISSIISMVIGFLIGLPFKFFRFVVETPKNFWIIRILTQTIYREKSIRLSVSYLFKIQIGNKYLLIKSNRINEFHPVGGAYKYYEEVSSYFKKLKINSDIGYEPDDINKNDLRIMIPGKNIMKFFKWFFSREGREVSQFREFYEEMIKPEFLDLDFLVKLKYSYLHSHIDGLKYSKHFKCKEILYSEIYNIILDEDQKDKIQNLVSMNNNSFVLVTEEEISRECTVIEKVSHKLGRNSKWLIKN